MSFSKHMEQKTFIEASFANNKFYELKNHR